MKPLYTLIILSLFIYSCKKGEESVQQPDAYMQKVKSELKDSVSSSDFHSLEFSKAIVNKVDSAGLYFLRIPFKGKSVAEDFVLVKTNKNGQLKEGKIIQLNGGLAEVVVGSVKNGEWEGSISLSSLNRKEVIRSDVHKGYIECFHKRTSFRESGDPIYPSSDLPEVVVIAYVHREIDYSFSTWLALNNFFNNSYNSGGGSGYYGSLDGNGGGNDGGGGGYGGGGNSTANVEDETIIVDIDTFADHESIDLENYLKCFDAIPDLGSQCEIGLYTDIPVDSDPNKLFDVSTGSPGHTFIGIKKMNGSQSVLQYIGFYPKNGWKNAFTNAPMDGKFVNDGAHEFNASYLKSLTPEEFKSILTEIRYLKNSQYDIDNFNCTDWALNVFNKQGYGLDIPLYDIPGSLPATGTSTPQGVYIKLKEMKNNNAPHSDRISIGFLKGWVADGNGPCN